MWLKEIAMKICLDNIIFSLQKAGGISVVWYELLKRLLNDPEIDAVFIDESNRNLLRNKLIIPLESLVKNPLGQYPIFIQRYLNPHAIQAEGIFHSSYYRTVEHSKMVNVTTVHDFTYEYFRKGFPKIVHQVQKRNAILNSKKIICVSQNTKKDLLHFYSKINDNQISVIYNGVGETYRPIDLKDDTLLSQLVSIPSRHYVLYVGNRIAAYKNFDLAVLACSITDIPLIVIGGGPFTKREKAFINKYLKAGHVEKLDNLSNEELNIVYNHALCLLYPSLYEGFGLPILEAQKAGCPVICSNGSSIPEIAGGSALMIEKSTYGNIAELLKQISHNPNLVSKLRILGFANADRFSWEKCYQQTKQVYKEVYLEYL